MVGQQVDTMVNPEHLAKLKEGVEAWNFWRSKLPEIRVDLNKATLSGTDLSLADLQGADLSRADLSGADLATTDLSRADLQLANLLGSNLRGADLSGANLRSAKVREAKLPGANLRIAVFDKADLSKADLSKADLREAKLGGADLREADLGGADLSGADLRGADLRSSNFDCATVGSTTFANNDLSSAKYLETVKHSGPSIVSIDVIYRSKGNISETFLRGCGVPDDFIVYMKSLAASPIEFYSCFISYSTKDQDCADRLYADLQSKGVRCWQAKHDIKAGRKLHEQIDEAIRLHDKLLLILSLHSMESEWVKTEILNAGGREVRDQRRVLFPIRLTPFEALRDWKCFDGDTGRDLAREIREYFIPDFSNWKKHDSYQEAFQRLISDLKASDTKPK